MSSKELKVYFPNLNGLRFIAASSVVVSHVEMVKMVFGQDNQWKTHTVQLLGHLGVILFFALSGFLITYLLLMEKKVTQKISIKDFYIRRILRIWPLYFFLIIGGLFLLPHVRFLDIPHVPQIPNQSWWSMALLYLVILPNVAVKLFPAVPFIGHTWSIGVEEQFYYLWPWLVKLSKKIIWALVGVIGFYLCILFLATYFQSQHPGNYFWNIFNKVWLTSSIDCMAIGGIFSWIYFHRKVKILQILYHPIVHLGVLFSTIALILLGIRFPLLHQEIYAILFSIIILNFSTNPKPIFSLENRLINYLGKVSYGIYMYHVLCIVICYKLIFYFLGQPHNLLLYISSYLLTFLVSALSYEWMEKYFIHLKSKFSKVISGDLVKDKTH